MKRIVSIMLVLTLMLTSLFPITAYAIGDGNIDNGSGDMGNGTNENYWNTGDEGVRVTVVRASDGSPVTTPIDFTNKTPANTLVNFNKVSKIQYARGVSLSVTVNGYTYVNPSKALPRIISSGDGNASIEAIKSYFTDELIVRYISSVTGFNYDTLINGDYKILLEPIAYLTFNGIEMAMTATEAALYDQQLNGGLQSKMASLTHKNLPLGMFLETPDLGYPAWSGSTTDSVSNTDIISSLGLGIVRFSEADPPPEISAYDYEYRVNTEVITAVTVRGGQADPDHPVSVTFNIGGRNYRVNNVYYPNSDSQLVWVRWTTPSTPQTMTITVSVSGGGSPSKSIITAKIVDLSQNDPPNPTANDRNDSYTTPSIPNNPQKTSASWGVWSAWWQAYWVWVSDWKWYSDGNGGGFWVDNGSWEDHGWWEFDWNPYSASLTASVNIKPDDKVPTASGNNMKSGYGINISVTANVSSNQSSAVTGAQTSVTYFPEFQYKDYWRLLDRTSSGYSARFEFKQNKYSTYDRRVHFTPVWFPNSSYIPYTYLIDCWTPAGMLSTNLTDTVTIQGSLWDDWHIAPVKP
ncbi:hypothetical protein [Desulfosporosinus metallidurans]|uniref:Uncharacterized protein n=1 Tax=Desulfosporosinus metallidurans TaxID=1888891 RepID=A0A1Q8QVN9_9FIRM|nr:hypothetical protein [Desulfosporosinus metallidurans]OLN31372.1 hypothetical protein DSOL_2711 [Desulfosporosinus metallidurans]